MKRRAVRPGERGRAGTPHRFTPASPSPSPRRLRRNLRHPGTRRTAALHDLPDRRAFGRDSRASSRRRRRSCIVRARRPAVPPQDLPSCAPAGWTVEQAAPDNGNLGSSGHAGHRPATRSPSRAPRPHARTGASPRRRRSWIDRARRGRRLAARSPRRAPRPDARAGASPRPRRADRKSNPRVIGCHAPAEESPLVLTERSAVQRPLHGLGRRRPHHASEASEGSTGTCSAAGRLS